MANEAAVVAGMDQLTKALEKLERNVLGGGSMGAGSEIRGRGMELGVGQTPQEEAAQHRDKLAMRKAMTTNTEALKHLREAQRGVAVQFEHSIKNQAELASALMTDAMDRLSYEQLDELPKLFEKQLTKANTNVARRLKDQYKTLDDIMVGMHKAANIDRLLEIKEELHALNENEVQLTEELNDEFERLGGTSADLDKTAEQLTSEMRTLTGAVGEASIKTGGKMTDFAKHIGGAIAAVGAAVAPFIDLAKKTAQLGGDFDLLSHVMMGMAPEELLHLQKEHRQLIMAQNGSMDEFNEKVKRGSLGMISYTGSIRDAIRVNAANLDNAQLLGVSQDQQTGFMDRQNDMFKRLNRTLGVTAEEFMELNKRLVKDEGVRTNLYRLNVTQRAAYIEDLQLTRQRLTQRGMEIEQAQKMVEVFAEIGAKSPKERLKEAAKLQAVAGAMGMGGIGAEAAGLIRGGMRGEGDKERMAELSASLQSGMSGMMSSGLAGEMQAFAMQEATGLQQYFSGPFQDQEIQRTKSMTDAVVDARMATESINGLLQTGIIGADIMQAAGANPVVKSLAGISALVGQILSFMKSGMALQAGSAMAGMGRGAAALGTAAAKGGAVLGAGAAGYAAGTALYNNSEFVQNASIGWFELLHDFGDAAEDKIQGWFEDKLGGVQLGDNMERLADMIDVEKDTLQKMFEIDRRGAKYWEDNLPKLIAEVKKTGDFSEAQLAVLKENNDLGKELKKATNQGNEDRKAIAQGDKKAKEDVTRVMWRRASTKPTTK